MITLPTNQVEGKEKINKPETTNVSMLIARRRPRLGLPVDVNNASEKLKYAAGNKMIPIQEVFKTISRTLELCGIIVNELAAYTRVTQMRMRVNETVK